MVCVYYQDGSPQQIAQNHGRNGDTEHVREQTKEIIATEATRN